MNAFLSSQTWEGHQFQACSHQLEDKTRNLQSAWNRCTLTNNVKFLKLYIPHIFLWRDVCSYCLPEHWVACENSMQICSIWYAHFENVHKTSMVDLIYSLPSSVCLPQSHPYIGFALVPNRTLFWHYWERCAKPSESPWRSPSTDVSRERHWPISAASPGHVETCSISNSDLQYWTRLPNEQLCGISTP